MQIRPFQLFGNRTVGICPGKSKPVGHIIASRLLGQLQLRQIHIIVPPGGICQSTAASIFKKSHQLSEIGIESENEYYVRVDETRIFKELGISDKDGIYAAIKMKNKARSEDERILAKYERAGKVLSAIVAGR